MRTFLLSIVLLYCFSYGDGFSTSYGLSWMRPVSRKSLQLSMSTLKIKEVHLQSPKLPKVSELYGKFLGFPTSEQEGNIIVEAFPNFNLKFSKYNGSRFHKGTAFIGLGLQYHNASSLFGKLVSDGGNLVTVRREFGDYLYSASLIPEEDDDLFTPVRYGWLQDFNGFRVELKDTNASVACKVSLNVVDPDLSSAFYTEVLGWKLYRRRAHVMSEPPDTCYTILVGDESDGEEAGVKLELVYAYMTESIDHGHAVKEIVLQASHLNDLLRRLDDKQQKYEVLSDGSGGILLEDPDGHKFRILGQSASSSPSSQKKGKGSSSGSGGSSQRKVKTVAPSPDILTSSDEI